MITKNHALVAQFGDTLDRLLNGIENFVANSRPTLGGERFLTDREVSARLKVSRRTLQDYRNTGMIAYYQLGGKILYKEQWHYRLLPVGRQDSLQGIGHRADACRQLPGGVQAYRHIMCCHPIRKKPTTEVLFFLSLSALSLFTFSNCSLSDHCMGRAKRKGLSVGCRGLCSACP